jgi:hypothetical protein
MDCSSNPSRRELLQLLPLVLLTPAATLWARSARAADMPLLDVNDPAARAVHYTPEAGTAKGVPPGDNCGNCALYLGKYSSVQGPCQLFPGKQVKAAGWCSSWAPQM